MSCECRRPIEPTLSQRTVLLLRTENDHLRAKIADALPHAVPERSWMRITDSEEGLRAQILALAESVTAIESESLHALLLGHNEELSLDRAFESIPFSVLHRRVKYAWLERAISTSAFSTHFQPIFHAAEPTRIFAREALLRIADTQMPIDRIFSVAQEMRLAPALDRIAREGAIDAFASAHFDGKLFMNFLPSSIYDPVACLATTFAALDRNGIAYDRVVMEVVESERIADIEHLRRVLDFYRERGVAVALDDLGSGFSSLTMLGLLRPDYVKLDIELISEIHLDPFKATLAHRLIEMAKELDLSIIAEGIETAEELAWVAERGVDFVQGFYLARPAAA